MAGVPLQSLQVFLIRPVHNDEQNDDTDYEEAEIGAVINCEECNDDTDYACHLGDRLCIFGVFLKEFSNFENVLSEHDDIRQIEQVQENVNQIKSRCNPNSNSRHDIGKSCHDVTNFLSLLVSFEIKECALFLSLPEFYHKIAGFTTPIYQHLPEMYDVN